MAEQVKVAVLEERLENFETLVSRLDSAIEKLAEVNNNVSRMLDWNRSTGSSTDNN